MKKDSMVYVFLQFIFPPVIDIFHSILLKVIWEFHHFAQSLKAFIAAKLRCSMIMALPVKLHMMVKVSVDE